MTLTDDRAALLAAIRADPDDDTPRLVYADWLQDHGEEERAELIRVQCELARLLTQPEPARHLECVPCNARRNGLQHTNGPCRCHPKLKEIRRRERTLLADHAVRWLTGIFSDDRKHTVVRTRGWVWVRGFVELVSIDSIRWLSCYEAIQASPQIVLRRVELTTTPAWSLVEGGEGVTDVGPELFDLLDLIHVPAMPPGFRHIEAHPGESVEDLILELFQRAFRGHCIARDADGFEYDHPIEWEFARASDPNVLDDIPF